MVAGMHYDSKAQKTLPNWIKFAGLSIMGIVTASAVAYALLTR